MLQQISNINEKKTAYRPSFFRASQGKKSINIWTRTKYGMKFLVGNQQYTSQRDCKENDHLLMQIAE